MYQIRYTKRGKTIPVPEFDSGWGHGNRTMACVDVPFTTSVWFHRVLGEDGIFSIDGRYGRECRKRFESALRSLERAVKKCPEQAYDPEESTRICAGDPHFVVQLLLSWVKNDESGAFIVDTPEEKNNVRVRSRTTSGRVRGGEEEVGGLDPGPTELGRGVDTDGGEGNTPRQECCEGSGGIA